jgi:Tat protein translocase TatB subunit
VFDIGWTEIALIAGAAVVLTKPEDMPRVLYNAGKVVRKIRRFTADIQKSLDSIIHEAEVDDITRDVNETIGGPDLRARIERQLMEEEDRLPEDEPEKPAP